MENWKAIPGFEGFYEATATGLIRRVESDTPLRPYLRSGYPCVALKVRGKRTLKAIHTIVLSTFVGPPGAGMQGAHLDGVKTNCALGNLAWVTKRENEAHKRAHGTAITGERSHFAKLSDAQALAVRDAAAAGITQAKLAILTGVSEDAISHVVTRQTYRHLD